MRHFWLRLATYVALAAVTSAILTLNIGHVNDIHAHFDQVKFFFYLHFLRLCELYYLILKNESYI